jgi:hypothetical protein
MTQVYAVQFNFDLRIVKPLSDDANNYELTWTTHGERDVWSATRTCNSSAGGALTCGSSHMPSRISRHVIFCLVAEPGRRTVKIHNRHPHRIPDAKMISI